MDTVPNILADRYASPAMRALWSPRGRVVLEREFWIAVLRAQRDLGIAVPPGAIEAYERVRDQVDLDSMDFLAFLEGVAARTGVEIPERAYRDVETIGGCVAYVAGARAE